MFLPFQFLIRQMAIKRLNIFVHHHEDINNKVKMLVDHILKDSEYKNNLLWDHLNAQVNDLIEEIKYIENSKIELEQQQIRFHEMNQMLEEIFKKLEGQKLLYQRLRQKNEHLEELPQTDLSMQDTSISHL